VIIRRGKFNTQEMINIGLMFHRARDAGGYGLLGAEFLSHSLDFFAFNVSSRNAHTNRR